MHNNFAFDKCAKTLAPQKCATRFLLKKFAKT
jgi:hypothetical protein